MIKIIILISITVPHNKIHGKICSSLTDFENEPNEHYTITNKFL